MNHAKRYTSKQNDYSIQLSDIPTVHQNFTHVSKARRWQLSNLSFVLKFCIVLTKLVIRSEHV